MTERDALADELDQRVDWRKRLIDAVMQRKFKDDTLVEMLCDGLREAHSEGLQDGAFVCDKVAGKFNGHVGRTATILARQIRALEKLNRAPSVNGEVTPAKPQS